MAKSISETRADAIAGNWPVAGPSPFVIDLLKRISLWDNESAMTPADKVQARREILAILTAWQSREDIDELRNQLGVSFKKGKRRTQRQVDKECAMAFEHAKLVAAGIANPREVVAEKFHVEIKTVERALAGFGDLATRQVTSLVDHLAKKQSDT